MHMLTCLKNLGTLGEKWSKHEVTIRFQVGRFHWLCNSRFFESYLCIHKKIYMWWENWIQSLKWRILMGNAFRLGTLVRVAVQYGDMPMKDSIKRIRKNGCDIFVATLGRLVHFVRDEIVSRLTSEGTRHENNILVAFYYCFSSTLSPMMVRNFRDYFIDFLVFELCFWNF